MPLLISPNARLEKGQPVKAREYAMFGRLIDVVCDHDAQPDSASGFKGSLLFSFDSNSLNSSDVPFQIIPQTSLRKRGMKMMSLTRRGILLENVGRFTAKAAEGEMVIRRSCQDKSDEG